MFKWSSFSVMTCFQIFMHTDADIPYYNTLTTDMIIPKNQVAQKIGIAVTDTENELEVC